MRAANEHDTLEAREFLHLLECVFPGAGKPVDVPNKPNVSRSSLFGN